MKRRRIHRPTLRLENLERRELLAADLEAMRHNAVEPLDVNNDSFVSAMDALEVINELNRPTRDGDAGGRNGRQRFPRRQQ